MGRPGHRPPPNEDATADPAAFTRFVPGLDFLQGLVKRGAGSVPSMSQWIAPTLDPAEIDKRIGELRTVQFWLEQNAKLIAASIQALEVQRMTLSTLQTMNLPLSALRDAMTLTPPPAGAFAAAGGAAAASPRDDADEPGPSDDDDAGDDAPLGAHRAARATGSRRRAASGKGGAAAAAAGGIDPMQWWGALTQQFGELAARAIKDVPGLSAAADAVAAARGGPDAAGAARAAESGDAAAPRAARSRATQVAGGAKSKRGGTKGGAKGASGTSGGKRSAGSTKSRVRARRVAASHRR